MRAEPDAHYQLTADIDLAVDYPVWAPLSFGGVFDGQNHSISHVSVAEDMGEDVGLFGALAAGAALKNLTVADSAIRLTGAGGAVNDVGVLVGDSAQATIRDVSVTGSSITAPTLRSAWWELRRG